MKERRESVANGLGYGYSIELGYKLGYDDTQSNLANDSANRISYVHTQ